MTSRHPVDPQNQNANFADDLTNYDADVFTLDTKVMAEAEAPVIVMDAKGVPLFANKNAVGFANGIRDGLFPEIYQLIRRALTTPGGVVELMTFEVQRGTATLELTALPTTKNEVMILPRDVSMDRNLREALIDYIAEERGHEAWILDDIDALGGDSAQVVADGPSPAVEAMVGYVAHSIDRHGPYAMLGMVHVLEGLSVDLAEIAAGSIAKTLAVDPARGGFSYLRSHGAVDQEHVRFFADLLDRVDRRADQDRIIRTAAVVYGLFGAIFQGIADGMEESHAA